METKKITLIEAKKTRPVCNNVEFITVVNDSLNSVSTFSENSVVGPELNSITEPIVFISKEKRRV